LIETAQGRIKYFKKNRIIKDNVNYIFEGYYSSVLELLHALVLSEGYKVSNHICLGFYLRDILKNKKLFNLFDNCRYKRNSLVYYGKRMDFEIVKESINRCIMLIDKLDSLIKD